MDLCCHLLTRPLVYGGFFPICLAKLTGLPFRSLVRIRTLVRVCDICSSNLVVGFLRIVPACRTVLFEDPGLAGKASIVACVAGAFMDVSRFWVAAVVENRVSSAHVVLVFRYRVMVVCELRSPEDARICFAKENIPRDVLEACRLSGKQRDF